MTTVYPAVGNLLQAQPKPDEEDNVWTRLLSEWGNKSGASGHGSVIVLGEPECGKTTLLRRMTKADKMSFSSALEYSFLNIQSDYNNGSYAYQLGSAAAGAAAAAFGSSDSINLPVFLLSGHECFVPLLKFAMPTQLTKACFVLTVSMSPPEKIIPSLEKWFAVAERVVKEHYSEEVIEAGRQAQLKYWQEYVEPIDSSMHGDPETTHDVEIDLSQVPLEPAVLTKNIGVPIIVVLTKCDLHTELKVSQLSKIQYHVRNFCLARGAALIYTSGKENLNTHMLYKYLAHRVYNLPFAQAACIVNHHSILIPTGWDSTQKIDIIAEDLPDTLPITAEDEDIMSHVLAALPPTEDETEENFLGRLEITIANSAKSTSPKRDQGTVAAVKLSPGQAGGMPNKNSDSSPIVSFFGNLMKKDTSKTSSTANIDPQTHFQKILSSNKPRKTSKAGDASPRDGLTANSSMSALSDQDMEEVAPLSGSDAGGDSQPPSARDPEQDPDTSNASL